MQRKRGFSQRQIQPRAMRRLWGRNFSSSWWICSALPRCQHRDPWWARGV